MVFQMFLGREMWLTDLKGIALLAYRLLRVILGIQASVT